jgi:hypothetical protein
MGRRTAASTAQISCGRTETLIAWWQAFGRSAGVKGGLPLVTPLTPALRPNTTIQAIKVEPDPPASLLNGCYGISDARQRLAFLDSITVT